MTDLEPDSRDSLDAYFLVCNCGCGRVVGISSDKPEYSRETAKWIANGIRDGLTVERHKFRWWRERGMDLGCATCGESKMYDRRKQKKKQATTLF